MDLLRDLVAGFLELRVPEHEAVDEDEAVDQGAGAVLVVGEARLDVVHPLGGVDDGTILLQGVVRMGNRG